MKNVGYVLMLDASGSMESAKDIVMVDAESFASFSLAKDQAGVLSFSNDAKWLCTGKEGAPITFSSDLSEIETVRDAIESGYKIYNMTNIAAAFTLGYPLYDRFTTEEKAFVLLSDGYHNYGSRKPEDVIRSGTPLYIAGLGPYFDEKNYKKIIEKDPGQVVIYKAPSPFQMMLMFNEIRRDITVSELLINDCEPYESGKHDIVRAFQVPSGQSMLQFGLTWSDKTLKYTDGAPDKGAFRVLLYGPDGKAHKIGSTIIGDGYCTFDIPNVETGRWQAVIQYASDRGDLGATVGVMDRNPLIHIGVGTPSTASERPQDLQVNVRDRNALPVENATVSAVVTKYRQANEAERNAYMEVARNADFSEVEAPLSGAREPLSQKEVKLAHCGGGVYEYSAADMGLAAATADQNIAYIVKVTVEGESPETGASYSYSRIYTL